MLHDELSLKAEHIALSDEALLTSQHKENAANSECLKLHELVEQLQAKERNKMTAVCDGYSQTDDQSNPEVLKHALHALQCQHSTLQSKFRTSLAELQESFASVLDNKRRQIDALRSQLESATRETVEAVEQYSNSKSEINRLISEAKELRDLASLKEQEHTRKSKLLSIDTIQSYSVTSDLF